MLPVVLPITKSGAAKKSASPEADTAGRVGRTLEKERDLTGPAFRSCNRAMTAGHTHANVQMSVRNSQIKGGDPSRDTVVSALVS